MIVLDRPFQRHALGQEEPEIKKAAMSIGQIVIGIGILVMVWRFVLAEKKAKKISYAPRRIRTQAKPLPR